MPRKLPLEPELEDPIQIFGLLVVGRNWDGTWVSWVRYLPLKGNKLACQRAYVTKIFGYKIGSEIKAYRIQHILNTPQNIIPSHVLIPDSCKSECSGSEVCHQPPIQRQISRHIYSSATSTQSPDLIDHLKQVLKLSISPHEDCEL